MRCCTSQSHRSPLLLHQPASPACAVPTEVCHAVPEHPHPHRFLGLGGASRAARPHPGRARAGPDSSPACPTRLAVPARRTGSRRPRPNGYKTSRADASVPVHTLVVWGDPAAEICRVAQERQMDSIAMSTHGRTGRTLELIGSVADAVVRRAPCAVLIFRATLFEAARG